MGCFGASLRSFVWLLSPLGSSSGLVFVSPSTTFYRNLPGIAMNGFRDSRIEEGTFLFTSESVGEGHPGEWKGGSSLGRGGRYVLTGVMVVVVVVDSPVSCLRLMDEEAVGPHAPNPRESDSVVLDYGGGGSAPSLCLSLLPPPGTIAGMGRKKMTKPGFLYGCALPPALVPPWTRPRIADDSGADHVVSAWRGLREEDGDGGGERRKEAWRHPF